MNIGIDIDEVLADLLEQYIIFLKFEYNISLSRKDFKKYYAWDKLSEIKENRINFFTEFYNSKYFENIKPVKHAVENIIKLKDNNRLYIITSRPAYLQDKTTNWITTYFPNTFRDIFFANYIKNKKKSEIGKSLQLDLMIEDSLDYAMEFININIPVILLSYPWNRHDFKNKNLYRIDSWNKIYKNLANKNYLF